MSIFTGKLLGEKPLKKKRRFQRRKTRLDLFSHVLQQALREFRGVHRLDDPHQTCDAPGCRCEAVKLQRNPMGSTGR